MRITKGTTVKLFVLIGLILVVFTACLTSEESTKTSEESTQSGTIVPAPPAGDMYAGGQVWDNWTKIPAGGTGDLPQGVVNKDFIRCKACHGWDAQGAAGGYVRRSGFPDNASRPRPTEGTDLSAKLGSITMDMASHGSGRAWALENNDAPNFTLEGGMSSQQVADAVAFLNDGPKIGDVAEIDIRSKPVQYRFVNANIDIGEDLYAANCLACHGPNGDKVEDVNLVEYLQSDGKYSEAFHKMIYGSGTGMTRQFAGSLGPEEARDILAWAQAAIK